MNLDIATLLMLLMFVIGFLAGGKWKARFIRELVAFEGSAKAKIDALRKHL